MLTDSIDAIALVGHAVSELSALKCEQLKPSLRPEFHTKCANNATTTSNLLFGDDLGNNSRREGDERLSKTVAGPSNKQFDQNKGYRRNRSWSNRSGKKKTPQKWITAAFFGQRPPLSGKKETLSRQERTRKEITTSLENKNQLAVSHFEPFIESQLDIPTSYRAFLRGAEGNYL